MFGHKKSETIVNDRELKAFLEYGCEFEGKFNFSGLVRLNGLLHGHINTEDMLVVGENAHIEAEIKVGAIVIGGKIIGNIVAKQKVEILATGYIEGTIVSPSIIVHEGAQIIGNLKVKTITTENNVEK